MTTAILTVQFFVSLLFAIAIYGAVSNWSVSSALFMTNISWNRNRWEFAVAATVFAIVVLDGPFELAMGGFLLALVLLGYFGHKKMDYLVVICVITIAKLSGMSILPIAIMLLAITVISYFIGLIQRLAVATPRPDSCLSFEVASAFCRLLCSCLPSFKK